MTDGKTVFAIFKLIAVLTEEKNINELIAATGKSERQVYRYLKIIDEIGFEIEVSSDERFRTYRLNEDFLQVLKNIKMALITKSGIFKKLAEDQRFLSISKNGGVYISTGLKGELDIENKDYLCLYEKDGNVYLLVASTDEEIKEGFQVKNVGGAFAEKLRVSSLKFALFVLTTLGLRPGEYTKVNASKLVTVDKKKMVQLSKD